MANDRITLIDTGYIRPGLCAAWLVHGEGGRAALVDCGTATCAQRGYMKAWVAIHPP